MKRRALAGLPVLLVPGFNTQKGEFAPVHALGPLLAQAGASVTSLEAYGRPTTVLDWFNVRRDTRELAERIVNWGRVNRYGVAIGHSNGASAIGLAAERGATFSTVLAVNPAQPVVYVWPPSVKRWIAYYSPSDVPTRIARWSKSWPVLRHFAPRRWGAAGAYGYNVTGDRGKNVNLERLLQARFVAHDDALKPPLVGMLAADIAGRLQA